MPKNLFRKSQSRTNWYFQVNRENKTFIVPKRLGLYILFFSIIFLGVAYLNQNNLVYIFVFIVFSFFATVMIYCNRNTNRILIESIYVKPFFSDLTGFIDLNLKLKGKEEARDIEVMFDEKHLQFVDRIDSQNSFLAKIPIPQVNRGVHSVQKIFFRSEFPFGFFSSWKFIRPKYDFFVYPPREGITELPITSNSRNTEGAVSVQGEMESFIGHKLWNPSISYRKIDWKVKARTGLNMIQNFDGGDLGPVELNWNQTYFIYNFEKKVNQLSLWVDISRLTNREFILNIGPWSSGWGLGDDHANKCWQRLALLDEKNVYEK